MKHLKLFIGLIITFAVGVLVISAGLGMGAKLDFYMDNTGFHVNNDDTLKTHEENLNKIDSINIDINSVEEIRIEEGDTYGIYYKGNEILHTFENGKLSVVQNSHDNKEESIFKFGLWNIFHGDTQYSYLSGDYTPKTQITVYVPKHALIKSLKIESGKSDVILNMVKVDEIDIENNYGDVNISNVNAKTLNSDLSCGDTVFDNVIAEKISCISHYGDINLRNSKISELNLEEMSGDIGLYDTKTQKSVINSNYGSIKLDNYITEDIIAKAQCGDIKITGEIRKSGNIEDSYGDIKLELPRDQKSYNIQAATKLGDVSINGEPFGNINNVNNDIKIYANCGDVTVDFNVKNS